MLDLHPLPQHPRIEVWQGGRRIPLGLLDDSTFIKEIRAARTCLNSVVREGLFQVQARRWFDGYIHYSSVEAWLSRREERGHTSLISAGLLRRTRSEMRTQGSTLVVHERIRATSLKKERASILVAD